MLGRMKKLAYKNIHCVDTLLKATTVVHDKFRGDVALPVFFP
jgi:hypothetical protein